MRVATATYRAFLRYASAQATAASQTLSAYLHSLLIEPVSAVKGGSQISGVTVNGSSTQFTFSGIGPQEVLEVIDGLITLFENVYAQLGGTPTDANVLAEMLFQLQTVEQVTPSFAGYVR